MANPFCISIWGEERLLAEALSIALRTRGIVATLVTTGSRKGVDPILTPEILIVTVSGFRQRIRFRLNEARASFPKAKIIVLGAASNKDLTRYVVENVPHCLLKSDSFERLVRTLDMLRIPDSFSLRSTEPDSMASTELTTREQDVFRSIAAGLSNKEIADLFSISTSTVKNHVHSILTKLNIRRRRYALGRTYVPPIHAGEAAIPQGVYAGQFLE